MKRIIDWFKLVFVAFFTGCGYLLYGVLYPFFRPRIFIRIAALTLLLLVTAGLVLWLMFLKPAFEPREGPLVESVFIVEKGSTLTKIGQLLRDLKIIESPLQFQILATLRGESTKLKAGRYRLTSRMAVNEILESLSRGTTYNNQLIIKEGVTSWQIASLMQQKLDMDSATIMQYILDSSFAASLGINDGGLEGYLFPDTYWFPWNVSIKGALEQMVERFLHVYARVYRKNSITTTYSRHKIVTMASIIEAEAVLAEERELISGVFYNRLRKRMTLGADPTVCYAFRKTGPQLTKSDLVRDHPYNTRVRLGLPPGPIGSPGEASLFAAINPATTDFLYFMARYDGTNGHYFTATYEEHKEMKELAEATLKRRRREGVLP